MNGRRDHAGAWNPHAPTLLLDDELLEGGQSLADMDARIRKRLSR
jgi:hypothetical protein